MSNLFMPKEQMDLEDLLSHKEKGPKEALVYTTSDGDVFAMDGLDSNSAVRLLGGGHDDVAFADGRLYACDRQGFVRDVMKDEEVYEHSCSITSLGVYNERLFFGDCLGNVYDVFNDKFVKAFAEEISSFCQHKFDFYCAADNQVYDVFTGEKNAERKGDINALFSVTDDLLFDGGEEGLYLNTSPDDLKVENFDKNIFCLFSWLDQFYVIDHDRDVYSYWFNKLVCELPGVYNIISVPREVVESVLS